MERVFKKMEKQQLTELKRQVKSYKNFFEKININPIYWVVNGKPYYMVIFTKGKQMKGTAYITSEGTAEYEEAKIAQKPLSLFSEYSNWLVRNKWVIDSVDFKQYSVPLSVEFYSKNEQALEGREIFEAVLEHIKSMERQTLEFLSCYDKIVERSALNVSDIEWIISQYTKVRVHQYKANKITEGKKKVLKQFADTFKK